MLELLRLAIALAGSAAGGAWDLKTTDVPDRLVFGMIGAGILLNALEWIIFGDFNLFLNSIIVTAVFGVFAIFMYKVGAWGGGDGAMLTAVGSLVPVWPTASTLEVLPFPLVYFIAVFLVGLPYSIAYTFNTVWRSPLKGQFVFSLRRNSILTAIFCAAAVPIFYLQPNVLGGLLALLVAAIAPIYILTKFAERAFYRKTGAGKLKEGDMLGEDLPQLKLWKRELRGLTGDEVRKIRKHRAAVWVRTGVPYTPVFFIALLIILAI